MILTLLTNLGLFFIPAAIAALVAHGLARSSKEEWRLLAWVPVLPLFIWGIVVAIAVTRDRTAHNLWPFELVFWGALSGVLFILVLAARWLATRSERSTTPIRRRHTHGGS